MHGSANLEGIVFKIDRCDIAGFHPVDQAFTGLVRIEFAGRDAVSEKDPSVRFAYHRVHSGSPECDRRVLTRTSAPEIFAGNYNLVLGRSCSLFNKLNRIEVVRKPNHRVRAEFLVLVRDRRNEGQVLRGYDLVGVDIVGHYVDRTGKLVCHNGQLIYSRGSVTRPVRAEAATVYGLAR